MLDGTARHDTMMQRALTVLLLAACAGKVTPKPSGGCEVLLSVVIADLGHVHDVVFRAKNVSQASVTITLPSRCAQSPIALSGLPEGYDLYSTCDADPCVEQPPVTRAIAPGETVELAAARIRDDGADVCQQRLAPGRYVLAPIAPQTSVVSCTTDAALAVNDEPPPSPRAPAQATSQNHPPKPPPPVAGLAVPPEYACESSADCALVCPEVRGCCGNPCGCRNAMNKKAAAAYLRDYAKTCAKPPKCPAMGCAYQPAGSADCHEGRCVATDGLGGF